MSSTSPRPAVRENAVTRVARVARVARCPPTDVMAQDIARPGLAWPGLADPIRLLHTRGVRPADGREGLAA